MKNIYQRKAAEALKEGKMNVKEALSSVAGTSEFFHFYIWKNTDLSKEEKAKALLRIWINEDREKRSCHYRDYWCNWLHAYNVPLKALIPEPVNSMYDWESDYMIVYKKQSAVDKDQIRSKYNGENSIEHIKGTEWFYDAWDQMSDPKNPDYYESWTTNKETAKAMPLELCEDEIEFLIEAGINTQNVFFYTDANGKDEVVLRGKGIRIRKLELI